MLLRKQQISQIIFLSRYIPHTIQCFLSNHGWFMALVHFDHANNIPPSHGSHYEGLLEVFFFSYHHSNVSVEIALI